MSRLRSTTVVTPTSVVGESGNTIERLKPEILKKQNGLTTEQRMAIFAPQTNQHESNLFDTLEQINNFTNNNDLNLLIFLTLQCGKLYRLFLENETKALKSQAGGGGEGSTNGTLPPPKIHYPKPTGPKPIKVAEGAAGVGSFTIPQTAELAKSPNGSTEPLFGGLENLPATSAATDLTPVQDYWTTAANVSKGVKDFVLKNAPVVSYLYYQAEIIELTAKIEELEEVSDREKAVLLYELEQRNRLMAQCGKHVQVIMTGQEQSLKAIQEVSDTYFKALVCTVMDPTKRLTDTITERFAATGGNGYGTAVAHAAAGPNPTSAVNLGILAGGAAEKAAEAYEKPDLFNILSAVGGLTAVISVGAFSIARTAFTIEGPSELDKFREQQAKLTGVLPEKLTQEQMVKLALLDPDVKQLLEEELLASLNATLSLEENKQLEASIVVQKLALEKTESRIEDEGVQLSRQEFYTRLCCHAAADAREGATAVVTALPGVAYSLIQRALARVPGIGSTLATGAGVGRAVFTAAQGNVGETAIQGALIAAGAGVDVQQAAVHQGQVETVVDSLTGQRGRERFVHTTNMFLNMTYINLINFQGHKTAEVNQGPHFLRMEQTEVPGFQRGNWGLNNTQRAQKNILEKHLKDVFKHSCNLGWTFIDMHGNRHELPCSYMTNDMELLKKHTLRAHGISEGSNPIPKGVFVWPTNISSAYVRSLQENATEGNLKPNIEQANLRAKYQKNLENSKNDGAAWARMAIRAVINTHLFGIKGALTSEGKRLVVNKLGEFTGYLNDKFTAAKHVIYEKLKKYMDIVFTINDEGMTLDILTSKLNDTLELEDDIKIKEIIGEFLQEINDVSTAVLVAQNASNVEPRLKELKEKYGRLQNSWVQMKSDLDKSLTGVSENTNQLRPLTNPILPLFEFSKTDLSLEHYRGLLEENEAKLLTLLKLRKKELDEALEVKIIFLEKVISTLKRLVESIPLPKLSNTPTRFGNPRAGGSGAGPSAGPGAGGLRHTRKKSKRKTRKHKIKRRKHSSTRGRF